MGWTFGLVDPSINKSLGEIPDCTERRVFFPLSRPDGASFKVTLDNRFADRLLECKDFVIVHDARGQIMLHGPIVTAEEDGTEDGPQTVAVTVGSPFWWLGGHLIGKSHAGTSFNGADSIQVLRTILNEANAEFNTYIGLADSGAAGAVTVGPWHYKPADEAFLEVVRTLGGPDWSLQYLDVGQVHTPGMKVADMRLAAARGADRSNTVFLEYGTGKLNLKGYKRAVSRAGLLTRSYGLPPGFPETTEAVTVSADPTLEATYGRWDAVVPNDIIDPTMRQNLQAEHVRLRRQPRQVITLTPYRDDSPQIKGPTGIGDAEPGDLVTARAVARGATRFDAKFRIYQWAFDIDLEGNATPSIDVVPDYA